MVIGAWGASITYGEGDEAGLGWVGRLRKHLPDHKVYNRGVCGNSTTELLRRFDVELKSIKPDVVLLSIGTNDSKFPHGKEESLVPITKFEANVKELIQKALEYTPKVVVIGLTNVCSPVTSKRGSRFSDEVISKYNDVLKASAEERNLQFVSMFGPLNVPDDFSDGLHPNSAGYEKMFNRVWKVLGI